MEKLYVVGRNILGDDIVFPEEIIKTRGLSYSDAGLKHLVDTTPSEEILYWCKANGYAVVAGPPTPMGLLQVRSLNPELFDLKTGRWYERSAFSSEDKAKTNWLAIRKELVLDSIRKTWDEQLRLLMEDEQVPNAGEMSWFVTTFYKARNIRLFERIRVRISSVSLPDDYHVHVGEFDEKGFSISECWNGRRTAYVGLAAARKL